MSKFSEEQAHAAYSACTINKTTQDSDQTIGLRCMDFTENGELYCLEAEHDVLPMDATAEDVKAHFINKLKNEVNYPLPPAETTTSEETKV